MTAQPIEARCDHCKQPRPLFLYTPECGMHLGANAFTCPWCSIDKRPLLCPTCWSFRKEAEDSDPALIAEHKTLQQICATNARVEARKQAERDICEGIAKATEERAS